MPLEGVLERRCLAAHSRKRLEKTVGRKQGTEGQTVLQAAVGSQISKKSNVIRVASFCLFVEIMVAACSS